MSNLTPDERARIVEEERLRAQVRRQQVSPVHMGCAIGVIITAVGFVWGLIASLF